MHAVAGVVNGRIYVIGGIDGTGALGTNEEFDPSLNTWRARSPMPTARWLSAVEVVNNRIYVIGGQVLRDGPTLAVNEQYDPNTDTWTSRTPMPTTRTGPVAVVVNSKIWALGGATVNDANVTLFTGAHEEYDPVSNSWQTAGQIPTPRAALAAAVVNNAVYVIGGSPARNSVTSANEAFDLLAPTFFVFRRN
jgi:N-acetylneuraminic acid mutarotase